jgi:hypothetical protein
MDLSDGLHDLFFTATQAAGHSLTPGHPLAPFAVIEDRQTLGSRLVRCPADRLEDMLMLTRHVVGSTDGVTRAVVDGFFTSEGRRTDAVYFEGCEVGDIASAVMVQRYETVGRFRRRVSMIGRPILLSDRAQPLFA